ncbi:MAG: four helix bundle protein [Planctomycetes bacterium]|nr:four helix bundle protein [Planctomycetota bacterium]
MNPEKEQKKQERLFDHERLDAYRLTLEYLAFLVEQEKYFPAGAAGVRDHLDRAGDSILLNLSEGNGKPRGSRDRSRYLRAARGSAGESAAAWDILRVRGFAPASSCDRAKGMLARISAMLHGLGA